MIRPLFIGTTELLLIAGLALLLFGGKKLPELMKGLGQGVQNFKKGMSEPMQEAPDKKAFEENSKKEDSSQEKHEGK
jgi:sec-independent protein translocase protein TatA